MRPSAGGVSGSRAAALLLTGVTGTGAATGSGVRVVTAVAVTGETAAATVAGVDTSAGSAGTVIAAAGEVAGEVADATAEAGTVAAAAGDGTGATGAAPVMGRPAVVPLVGAWEADETTTVHVAETGGAGG